MGRPAKHQMDEVRKRAMRLFWEHGSEGVTTRDLEEALDLRAPAIYRRFGSKEALFLSSVDYYIDTVIAGRVQSMLDGSEDPIRGLHTFFMTALEPPVHQRHLRGCLLVNTATHADGQLPAVNAALARGWNLVDQGFQRTLRRAQAKGQIDAEHDPAALSQALLMSLQGLLTVARANIVDPRPGLDATFRLLGAATCSASEGSTTPTRA